MKKFYLPALMMLATLLQINLLIAQKVKLKDLDVKVNYLNFPAEGFPMDVTSYHVQLDGDENRLNSIGFTISGIKQSIGISGYTQTEEAIGGKVLILLNGPFAQAGKLNTTDKQDSKGVKWQEHYYSVPINMTATMKILDAKGKLLKEEAFPYNHSVNTNVYRTQGEAANEFKAKAADMAMNGQKAAVSECIGNMVSRLRFDFGLEQEKDNVELKSLKEKEHPEFADYAAIDKIVVAAFAKMTVNDNSAYIKEIQPAIDFWLAHEAKYSGTDKEQKKLKYACQYNTALAYFWADDYDNATKYATMVANGTEDEKDGKKLNEKIIKVKAKQSKLGWPSRHFKVQQSQADLEKAEVLKAQKAAAIASGDISQFVDFNSKLDVKVGTRVEKGIVYHSSGRIDTGYFAYESEDIRPDFRFPDKIRFGYLKAGVIATGSLKYSGLKSFVIKDLTFMVEDVKLGDGLFGVKLDNAVVETIDAYSRTSFCIIYPPFKNAQAILGTSNDDLEPSFAVYNKSLKKYLAVDGLMGPSKALLKIVEGCAPAETYAKEKKEELSKKSVLHRLSATANPEIVKEALKLYDGCK